VRASRPGERGGGAIGVGGDATDDEMLAGSHHSPEHFASTTGTLPARSNPENHRDDDGHGFFHIVNNQRLPRERVGDCLSADQSLLRTRARHFRARNGL
jgi:hypothetical protein